MSAFATAEDYIARYGEVDDTARLTAQLEDASNYILSLYIAEYGEDYEKGAHPVFDLNAPAVVCGMVSRVLNVPADMAGVSTASQSADIYSASYTFANPTGDFYATKSDKERLGLGGTRIGTIEPLTAPIREQLAKEVQAKLDKLAESAGA